MTKGEIVEGLKLLEDNIREFDELQNDKGEWIDVHELLFEAITLIESKKKYERFLPCICGRNSRSTWFGASKDAERIKLVCNGCGRFATGKNEADAKRNWNKMIRGDEE